MYGSNPTESRRRRSSPGPTKPESVDCLYVGVDEAGYGPNLGPLVVAATLFEGPQSAGSRCWWKGNRKVSRAGAGGGKRFIIDDSKQVYRGGDGWDQLARTVESAAALVGVDCLGLAGLIRALAPDDHAALTGEHWWADDGEAIAPPDGGPFSTALAGVGVALADVLGRVVFPPAFNERMAALDNKAQLELELIVDLLRRSLVRAEERGLPFVRIVVDRLGGRRNYRELVEELADGAFVQVVDESPSRSLYRYDSAGREVEIGFYVGGDGLHLPIALASMTAKYLRERCMRRFNAHWTARVPDLVPTAGYPGDSRRFLEQIQPHLADLPLARIWREK